jgi:hypothetical protein
VVQNPRLSQEQRFLGGKTWGVIGYIWIYRVYMGDIFGFIWIYRVASPKIGRYKFGLRLGFVETSLGNSF